MPAIDFITALGRLLRDGDLRDAFAIQPELVANQLGVCAGDRTALLALVPEDLELQASVLLRKRLDAVRHIIPQTCHALEAQGIPHFAKCGQAWSTFLQYARTTWPSGENPAVRDAFGFCRFLEARNPGSLDAAEWHRLQFALSKRRFAIHPVRCQTKNGKTRPALQFLLQPRPNQWREWVIYLAA